MVDKVLTDDFNSFQRLDKKVDYAIEELQQAKKDISSLNSRITKMEERINISEATQEEKTNLLDKRLINLEEERKKLAWERKKDIFISVVLVLVFLIIIGFIFK